MAIRVHNISKSFGQQTAVDRLSFTARKGEVLGFLGPNGAGKSTMMKMLTGILTPDEGEIEVLGNTPYGKFLAAKRKIGYLPERNPLYEDLYVREYLSITAQCYGFRRYQSQIELAIGRVGLQEEAHKKIGQLSKGFRQRVGIAQALVHDPEVLILDEPISGLDPNQLAEIRNLIKELSADKCIVLSTHIMQEVQAVCDRVLILHKGRKAADESIAYLADLNRSEQVIHIEFLGDMSTALFEDISGISRVEAVGARKFKVFGDIENDLRPVLFDLAVTNQLTILEMKRGTNSVEQVFQSITKNP